jgi:hypothetical protein
MPLRRASAAAGRHTDEIASARSSTTSASLERRYNALARNTIRLKEWLDLAAACKNAPPSIPGTSEAALWEAI